MKLSTIFNLPPDVYHVTGNAANLDNLENIIIHDVFYNPNTLISYVPSEINLENYDSEILNQVFKHYFGGKCTTIGEYHIAVNLLELEDSYALEHYIFYPTARISQALYNEFIECVKRIQKDKNIHVYIFSYFQTNCKNINIDDL